MDQLKAPIRTFPAQSDLVRDKGYGHIRQLGVHGLDPTRHRILGQAARERQVKAELFKDIRIAPLGQQRLLPGAEPRLAATRKLCLIRWRAKPIKIAHTGLCDALQAVQWPKGREGQKPAKRCQLQAITACRSQPLCHSLGSLLQSLKRLALFQPKGWFQSAVKPIFARCFCDILQAGQIELRHLLACHNIPAQPTCAKFGQRAVGRHIVNCETSV